MEIQKNTEIKHPASIKLETDFGIDALSSKAESKHCAKKCKTKVFLTLCNDD